MLEAAESRRKAARAGLDLETAPAGAHQRRMSTHRPLLDVVVIPHHYRIILSDFSE